MKIVKSDLYNLSQYPDLLIDHVATELEEYKKNRAAGNPYGNVRLSDIQKYERAMQLAQFFSDKGRAVYNECRQILAQDARLYQPKEQTIPQTAEERYREKMGHNRL